MADLSFLDGLILEYLLYTHDAWKIKAQRPGFKDNEEAKEKLDAMIQLLERSGGMPAKKSEKFDAQASA